MTTHMHACMHACAIILSCTDWARLGWAEIKTEATLLQHRADGRSRCKNRGGGGNPSADAWAGAEAETEAKAYAGADSETEANT